MKTLFDTSNLKKGPLQPLADRLRPTSLEEVLGQGHLLGTDAPLTRMISAQRLSSFIFWGPPGTGKTTIARLLSNQFDIEFVQFSAVFSGVSDLRKAIQVAKTHWQAGRGTLLFVDEIHRFNRAQQDGFLPVIEDGTIVLVGATTQNPSFELNSALLSRCQVFLVKRLGDDSLDKILHRAEIVMGYKLPLDQNARTALKAMSDGDGRYLLNLVEVLIDSGEEEILDTTALTAVLQQRAPSYDRLGDEHYNLVSALHKSIRGSDPDAALYWLARMLVGGEDPLYIIRRLVRIAMEDIGTADPTSLVQALAAKDAYQFLGVPEGELVLAQVVIYLATAKKSNAVYRAMSAAKHMAGKTGSLVPPKHILNAPTKLMKSIGYGKDYIYDHSVANNFSGQNYFPEGVNQERLYVPLNQGYEIEIRKRLREWAELRSKHMAQK